MVRVSPNPTRLDVMYMSSWALWSCPQLVSHQVVHQVRCGVLWKDWQWKASEDPFCIKQLGPWLWQSPVVLDCIPFQSHHTFIPGMLHAHVLSIGFKTVQIFFQSILPEHPRKDRYNSKLRKYYVIYGEEEDDISENEEQHQHQESGEVSWPNASLISIQCPKSCRFSVSPPEATEEVSFKMLGQEGGDSESEEDDEKEKEAEQVNVAEKDCGIVQGLVGIYNISTCHSNPYHIERFHSIPFRGNISNCHTNRLSHYKMTRSFHDHTSSMDCNIKSAHHIWQTILVWYFKTYVCQPNIHHHEIYH